MASTAKKLAYAAVAVSVMALLAASYLRKDIESVTFSRSQMGTLVQITLMEGDESSYEAAANAAFDEISRLEGLLSSYRPESDVSRVSNAAGEKAVRVSPEVMEVIEEALMIARLSGGAFDPTVGALARAWGYSGEKGRVPAKEEVEKLLPLVDYTAVKVDAKGGTVMLAKKGMVLNLGGVAKGYIVKKAVEVLKARGMRRGIIHAGGDMTVFQTGEEKPFIIGIQHPREKKLLGEMLVNNGAVATSGDYERFFEKDGVRYHHILDPATGFPARKSRSATVTSVNPTQADALSTAVFVMGPEKGMELIESLDKVEGVLVDGRGKVFTSSGFKGRIF
ncbi:MAG: FAD:protein FMN transferase [Deltaproteobacteria bacterium]|nr:FAD:protein FMN transferase [Deltaproteobacteria bacterium]